MNQKNKILFYYAIIAVLFNLNILFANEEFKSQIIVNASWGSSYNQIGLIEASEERMAVGPASFAVNSEGNIFILDTVNNRIQGRKKDLNKKNFQIKNIQINDYCVDFTIDNDLNLYTLHPEYLTVYSISGQLLKKRIINNEIKYISNISVDQNKNIYIIAGDQKNYKLSDSLKRSDYIKKSGIKSRFTNEIYLTKKIGTYKGIVKNMANGFEFEVNTTKNMASIIYIDSDKNENIYLSVESFIQDNPIKVLREIRKYTSKGKLIGYAVLDMGYHSFPRKDIVIDQDGNFYQMKPLKKGVYVLKWEIENIK